MAKKSASDVKMGGASVAIGADSSLFERIVSGSEKRLRAFGKAARDIGTRWSIGGGGFVAGAALITKSFMEVGSAAGGLGSKLRLSNEDILSARAMKSAYRELNMAIFDTKNALGAALAPAFTVVFKAITAVLKPVTAWIKDNKGIVTLAVAVGASIAATGAALIGLGTAAGIAAKALGVVSGAIAFMTSPLGLIVAAVAAISAALYFAIRAFVKFTDVGKSWASSMGKLLANVIKYIKDIANGIGNALMGGAAMLAIEIFWKGFQLAGLKAIKSLSEAFKKALGPLYVNMGGQQLLGITDAQLKAREDELNALLAKAKGLAQPKGGSVAAQTLERLSTPANARFSSGAASTIAGAYNQQQKIPIQTLMELKKIAAYVQQGLKRPPVKVKQVTGP